MAKKDSKPGRREPSRRQFIKKSSVLVAGGALATGLSIARSAHAAGDEQVKVALIGCGGRGSGAANEALNTKGDVKLIAMADAFTDKLEKSLHQLKKHHGDRVDVPQERRFVGFDAYKEAIAAGPDMVILTTPPGFRPIHFAAAVEAGKHVFMEKPVAVDAPGIRQVLAAAEEAKRKSLRVGVGLQRRHQNSYIETVKRLQDGAIGDVLLTRVYWNGGGVWVRGRTESQTEMEYQMRNWYYFNWLCGDHIAEQHIHNLDVSNWIKDAFPVAANGMGGREVRKGPDHGQIFDHHFVEFTYADDSKMFSQCRHQPGCWSHVSEYAHGTTGTSHVGGAKISTHDDWRFGGPWRFRGPNPNPYQVEHDVLFDAIRNGKPMNEAEYGAKSTMTSILGRMATYSGKPVTWDEAINSQISLAPQDYDFAATPPVVPDADGKYPVPIPGLTRVV